MISPQWRKSSFSASSGTCVELADLTEWRKATASGHDGGECVETADLPDGTIGVRDSKLGDDSPVLTFTRDEMRAFVQGVRAGEFDDLT